MYECLVYMEIFEKDCGDYCGEVYIAKYLIINNFMSFEPSYKPPSKQQVVNNID